MPHLRLVRLMETHKDNCSITWWHQGCGRTVRTNADLDEAIQAGLPRAALEHLMGAVAPESEGKVAQPRSTQGQLPAQQDPQRHTQRHD